MFGALTEKLQTIFSGLAGQKKITEENIRDAVREVRLALLEADVAYGVAKALVQRVKDVALGEAVLKAVSPGQQFIKIVHDALIELMGGQETGLVLQGSPPIVMVCGLQGSGKTTFCGKLAKYLHKQGKVQKPLLVACDLQRPAAVQQLRVVGEQARASVFALDGETDPLKVVRKALQQAESGEHDLLIVDTAGRLHIDAELMDQLKAMRDLLKPQEILFVANAATGQDAVNAAAEFNKSVEVTGTVLTMLDGNTRGGAAISIREVTQKPLKFEGIGERVDDLQIFNPTSMADRILGMGDTINLVKKAKEHFDEEEAAKYDKKLRKASFSYEDYLNMMGSIRKMGSIKGLLKMLPGMSQMPDMDQAEGAFGKMEAIILSMTPAERQENVELIQGRRKRIARGSGTQMHDVDKLVKSFKQAKLLFKNMPKMKNKLASFGG